MDFVIYILNEAIGLYSILLIIYIFMSWVPSVKESSIGRFLERICEPYLEPFRRFIPPFGMIDVSPIVAILVLNLARGGLEYLSRIV
ncbi:MULTISPECIES: YggT family protein [Paenisporosarcina]|jgi:YggT family protein|uniref:YggT family protein n=1 Tax=Paenisporosarcina quisquiliarum TaxID=365346 RepID=A0A9X3LCL9_9BACL|nr:YggT family protein [Paenisporosarcina quisquiliarum]MCZ8535567.1 YggT family protein [Paenisporosarcina quisquiliarum]